jgi:hypothetical protein
LHSVGWWSCPCFPWSSCSPCSSRCFLPRSWTSPQVGATAAGGVADGGGDGGGTHEICETSRVDAARASAASGLGIEPAEIASATCERSAFARVAARHASPARSAAATPSLSFASRSAAGCRIDACFAVPPQAARSRHARAIAGIRNRGTRVERIANALRSCAAYRAALRRPRQNQKRHPNQQQNANIKLDFRSSLAVPTRARVKPRRAPAAPPPPRSNGRPMPARPRSA